MEINWKFQVGQIVQFKAMGQVWRLAKEIDKYLLQKTYLAIVNSRLAEQCSGGIQLVYRVRPYADGGPHTTTVDIHEHELEAVEEATP